MNMQTKQSEFIPLFERLVKKAREDISTEILAYLLNEEDPNKQFGRKFINDLTGEKESEKFIFQTQKSTSQNGRPDIIGVNNKYTIIIENKLDSGLSDYDQLIKYWEIFDSREVGKMRRDNGLPKESLKTFILLAPTVRIKQAVKMTEMELGNSSIEDECLNRKVNFREADWESISKLLDENHFIERELKSFVEKSLSKVLSLEDCKRITSNLNMDDPLAEGIRDTLEIFAEDLEYAKFHYGGARFDIYFELKLGDKTWAWFGYFSRAIEKFGSDYAFSLELKNDTAIESWDYKPNIRKLKEDGRHIPAEWNNTDSFIPFDYSEYLSWSDQIKEIKEILELN